MTGRMLRISSGVALLVASMMSSAGANPAPTNLRPDNAQNLCLHLSGGKSLLMPCDGTDAQMFSVEIIEMYARRQLSRIFTGVNKRHCLEGAREGERLFAAPCRYIPEQEWEVTRHGGLKNYANGLCIDVYRGETAARTPVISYRCTGTVNQRWQIFKPAPERQDSNAASNVTMRPAHAQQKCLDATRDGRLLLWTCHGGQNQKFTFQYGRQTTIKVGNKCVTGSRSNAPTRVANCTGDRNQLWTVERNGQIRHSQGGCLDVKSAATNDGAEVLRFECRNQRNQRFAAVR